MFFLMNVTDKKKLCKIELLYEELCTLRHIEKIANLQ